MGNNTNICYNSLQAMEYIDIYIFFSFLPSYTHSLLFRIQLFYLSGIKLLLYPRRSGLNYPVRSRHTQRPFSMGQQLKITLRQYIEPRLPQDLSPQCHTCSTDKYDLLGRLCFYSTWEKGINVTIFKKHCLKTSGLVSSLELTGNSSMPFWNHQTSPVLFSKRILFCL